MPKENFTNYPELRTLPAEGLVRLPVVLSVIPVSKSSWYEGIKSGKYPKGIKLGPKTTAWRVEEIRKLVEEVGDNES